MNLNFWDIDNIIGEYCFARYIILDISSNLLMTITYLQNYPSNKTYADAKIIVVVNILIYRCIHLLVPITTAIASVRRTPQWF